MQPERIHKSGYYLRKNWEGKWLADGVAMLAREFEDAEYQHRAEKLATITTKGVEQVIERLLILMQYERREYQNVPLPLRYTTKGW